MSPAHKVTKTLAIVSVGASLLAMACEIVRAVQEIERLMDRYYTFVGAYQATFDAKYRTCAYFVPSTDVSYAPGAIGFTPLWHLLNALFLALIAISEIPGTDALGRWMTLFAPESSTWEAGSLQLLISLGMLGSVIIFPEGPTLPGIIPDVVSLLRYISALILFGISIVNIILGTVLGSEVRVWRGQAHPPEEDEEDSLDEQFIEQSAIIKEKWLAFKATLCTVHGSVAFGPLYTTEKDLEKAIAELPG